MLQPTLLSVEDVRAALGPLTLKQLALLAERSGVPATTIYKIRRGETGNPGLETVRQFMAHLPELITPAHPAPQPQGERDAA